MLDPEQVLASDIVANSTMNRMRGLAGANSYARELGFDPMEWLAARNLRNGHAAWYDACCGEGRALREAFEAVRQTPQHGDYRFYGVDLIGPFFSGDQSLRLVAGDVLTYGPGEPVDLVTCVHGLHYLGDKLGFLEHAYRLLAPGGMFVGHLDLDNIRIQDGAPVAWRALAARPRAAKVKLTMRRRLLTMEKTAVDLSFGLRYLGASISKMPNYIGITVMDSWYTP